MDERGLPTRDEYLHPEEWDEDAATDWLSADEHDARIAEKRRVLYRDDHPNADGV